MHSCSVFHFISFEKSSFEILCTNVLGAGELTICFFRHNKIYCISRKRDKLCHLVRGSFCSHVPNGLLENVYNSTEVFGPLML